MTLTADQAGGGRCEQLTLDDTHEATRLLSETNFVVVDLETTGGSATDCTITEIGAVKVRGGEVLGEFQTLVNPGAPIPPFIAVLTGITDSMVAGAPSEAQAIPSFLTFAEGTVLVAHNAPFDTGFLKAATDRLGIVWPGFQVLDTVRLARQVLTRDEAPNVKLATLARVFRTQTQPSHRALADARATVEVLHGLMERLGNRGVHSLGELAAWQHRVTPAQRAKRHLADHLPDTPGVYVFRDGQGRALYVGKSRRLRSRVRTYFTSSETRRRMAEMIAIATEVQAISCASDLEAEVRELRLIHAHAPPYNRRSKHPERETWVKVTVEAFPRLSIVQTVRDDGATYLGPFRTRRHARLATDAIYRAAPIRQCTTRLSPSRPSGACVVAELGRCGAPCTGAQDVAEYAEHVEVLLRAVSGDVQPLVSPVEAHLWHLAAAERFEEAALERDRLQALSGGLERTHRLAALSRVAELVAARPDGAGGWELHVVRHARLAAAGRSRPGEDPRPTIEHLLAGAETVNAAPPPAPAGSVEEAERVSAWLGQPGVRLVSTSQGWASAWPSVPVSWGSPPDEHRMASPSPATTDASPSRE